MITAECIVEELAHKPLKSIGVLFEKNRSTLTLTLKDGCVYSYIGMDVSIPRYADLNIEDDTHITDATVWAGCIKIYL